MWNYNIKIYYNLRNYYINYVIIYPKIKKLLNKKIILK